MDTRQAEDENSILLIRAVSPLFYRVTILIQNIKMRIKEHFVCLQFMNSEK